MTLVRTCSVCLFTLAALLDSRASEAAPPSQDELNSRLLTAAQETDVAAVAALLKQGAQVGAMDYPRDYTPFRPYKLIYEGTPLHYAARHGRTAIAKLLLEHGAKVDAMDRQGNTPLAIAAREGHVEVARLLIGKGANVRLSFEEIDNHLVKRMFSRYYDFDHGPALVYAARQGHGDMVELLLKAGAPANSRDVLGRSPLGWACLRGDLAMMRLLIEHKADVNRAFADVRDRKGIRAVPPIDWAAAAGQNAAIQLLLKSGVQGSSSKFGILKAAEGGHLDTIKLLRQHGAQVHPQQPMIAAACKNGHFETARYLIDAGANIDATLPKTYESPLGLASRRGLLALVRYLIEKGAKLNNGYPLLEAAQANQLEAMMLLIKAGADVHQQHWEMNALGTAAKFGRPAAVKLLLEGGANPNRTALRGAAPMHFAAQSGNIECAKLLIDAGGDPNLGLGETVVRDNPEMFQYLVKRGAKPPANLLRYACESGGAKVATLLVEQHGQDAKDPAFICMVAYYHGDPEFTALLLKHGADVNAKMPVRGISPLMCAVDRGNLEVARLLIQKGAVVNPPNEYLIHIAVVSEHLNPDLVEMLVSSGASIREEDLNLARRKDENGVMRRETYRAIARILERGLKKRNP